MTPVPAEAVKSSKSAALSNERRRNEQEGFDSMASVSVSTLRSTRRLLMTNFSPIQDSEKPDFLWPGKRFRITGKCLILWKEPET